MSGILRLESLTKGNTLKQGDKTPLKYRLFDADGEKLNIAGKSAKVRLVYPDFLTIGYEKEGLTVAQDDTVTFTIDNVIPAKLYHVEIIVDEKFIFPSREDESKFTVDKSTLGADANIIEVIGKDALVRDIMAKEEIQNVLDSKQIAEEAKIISETANQNVRDVEARQTQVEQFNNQVVAEMTDKDVISAPEIILARGGESTLGERLDKEHNEVTTQLAEANVHTEGWVNIKEFGAVGDGETNDTTAVFNAIKHCIDTNGNLFVPPGVFMIDAGVMKFTITNGLSFSIQGVGKQSAFKVNDGTISNWSEVFSFRIRTIYQSIDISNLSIDNNASGSDAPINNYDFEQSHTFRLTVDEGFELGSIIYNNVLVKDPVADGFNNSGTGLVKLFKVVNCQELDRNRVRSSIQFSHIPLLVFVDNFSGHSIESEDLTKDKIGSLQINNATIERLDIDTGPRYDVFLNNVTVSRETFFNRCKVMIVNSYLKVNTNGRWNGLTRQSKITSSEILIPYDVEKNTITGLNLKHNITVDTDVTFDNCDFIIDYQGDINPSGWLITDDTAYSETNTEKNIKRFTNCRFDERAENSIRAYRNGEWELKNNVYGGSVSAIDIGASSGFYAKLTVDGGDFSKVSGSAFGLTVSGTHQLILLGNHIGINASKYMIHAGVIGNFVYYSARHIISFDEPIDGLVGDRYVKGSDIKICSNHGSPATWKLLKSV